MEVIEYQFKVLKFSWGISINVIASITKFSEWQDRERCQKVVDGLWFLHNGDINFDTDEIEFIKDGLYYEHESIGKRTPFPNDTLVVINAMEFGFCDYQPEGLKAAIAEWAAHAFSFEAKPIDITFDKDSNRYILSYI